MTNINVNEPDVWIDFENRFDDLADFAKSVQSQVQKKDESFTKQTISQEKYVINKLTGITKKKNTSMKKFMNIGVGAGIAALGLTAMAPVLAVTALAVAAGSIIKSKSEAKKVKLLNKDISEVKKNVNKLLGKSKSNRTIETSDIMKKLRTQYWSKKAFQETEHTRQTVSVTNKMKPKFI